MSRKEHKPTIQEHVYWGVIVKLMGRLNNKLICELDAMYDSDNDAIKDCEKIDESLMQISSALDRELFLQFKFNNLTEAKHVYYGSARNEFVLNVLDPTLKVIREETERFIKFAKGE